MTASAAFAIAFSAAPAAFAQVAPRGDTILDVEHAFITASIVGCDVKPNDAVLVNGKAADGITWDRLQVVPAHPMGTQPIFDKLLELLKKSAPKTLPLVSFRLKSGYYRALALTVGGCALQPVPLIATDSYSARQITLIARSQSDQAVRPNSVTGLYGGIPLLDVQVWLVGIDTPNSYTARNEDDTDPLGHHYMYFFDAVTLGRYKLIVRGFGWERDLGEVSLKEPEIATFREITADQLGIKP